MLYEHILNSSLLELAAVPQTMLLEGASEKLAASAEWVDILDGRAIYQR